MVLLAVRCWRRARPAAALRLCVTLRSRRRSEASAAFCASRRSGRGRLRPAGARGPYAIARGRPAPLAALVAVVASATARAPRFAPSPCWTPYRSFGWPLLLWRSGGGARFALRLVWSRGCCFGRAARVPCADRAGAALPRAVAAASCWPRRLAPFPPGVAHGAPPPLFPVGRWRAPYAVIYPGGQGVRSGPRWRGRCAQRRAPCLAAGPWSAPLAALCCAPSGPCRVPCSPAAPLARPGW